MIFFSTPCNQDRLNATVFELLQMRFNGSVHIGGAWDASDTLDYLEQRMRRALIPTVREDGTLFCLLGKCVHFAPDHVVVGDDLTPFLQAC
jgi:hypothetical protein